MGQISVDYFLLIFVAASGALQMAASQSGLKGMMFFSRPSHSLITGLVMVVGAFLWFFLSAPRNVSDTQGGLDGNTQTGLFAAGAGAALAFTLLFSSLKNLSLGEGNGAFRPGLEALKETSFFRALANTLRDLWKHSLR